MYRVGGGRMGIKWEGFIRGVFGFNFWGGCGCVEVEPLNPGPG